MNFYNKIKELCEKEKLVLFVDMDGVIASFEFGKPLDFKNKRPLYTNIGKLEKINSLNNIELHILSVCRDDYQIEEKINWLRKYAPFFKVENVHILSKHGRLDIRSSQMKSEFLKEYKTDKKMALIDDDIRVLKKVNEDMNNIYLFQDSELID